MPPPGPDGTHTRGTPVGFPWTATDGPFWGVSRLDLNGGAERAVPCNARRPAHFRETRAAGTAALLAGLAVRESVMLPAGRLSRNVTHLAYPAVNSPRETPITSG